MADSWHTISGFATAMRGLADGLGKVGHEVGYLGWQTFGQPMGPPVYFHNRKLHFEALPNTGGSQFGQRALLATSGCYLGCGKAISHKLGFTGIRLTVCQ